MKKVVDEQCGLISLKGVSHVSDVAHRPIDCFKFCFVRSCYAKERKKIISPVPMSKLHLAIGRVPIGSWFIHAKDHGRRCLSVRL